MNPEGVKRDLHRGLGDWRGGAAAAAVTLAVVSGSRLLASPLSIASFARQELATTGVFYAVIAFAVAAAYVTAWRLRAGLDSPPQSSISGSLTPGAGDPDTQAYSRGFLEVRLAEELGRAQRYDTILSFVVVELDGAEAIRRTSGDEFTHRVLRQLSALLRMEKRKLDVIGRWGASSLAVVLPETGGSAAFALADRFRKAVGAHPFEFAGRAHGITVSLGIASFPGGSANPATLATEAEAALLVARQRGGNMTLRYLSLVPPEAGKIVRFPSPRQ